MPLKQRLTDIASALAEPASARMLAVMLDGRARTADELAVAAQASHESTRARLARLAEHGLVRRSHQGPHRYYGLAGAGVAATLEALLPVATVPHAPAVSRTPARLRWARSCYDHLAGTLAVTLLEHLLHARWLTEPPGTHGVYEVTDAGERALGSWGVDVGAARARRRRFACGCLDRSERRPHLGGALGAAMLHAALERGWLVRDAGDRAVRVTPRGLQAWLAPLDLPLAIEDAPARREKAHD